MRRESNINRYLAIGILVTSSLAFVGSVAWIFFITWQRSHGTVAVALAALVGMVLMSVGGAWAGFTLARGGDA